MSYPPSPPALRIPPSVFELLSEQHQIQPVPSQTGSTTNDGDGRNWQITRSINRTRLLTRDTTNTGSGSDDYAGDNEGGPSKLIPSGHNWHVRRIPANRPTPYSPRVTRIIPQSKMTLSEARYCLESRDTIGQELRRPGNAERSTGGSSAIVYLRTPKVHKNLLLHLIKRVGSDQDDSVGTILLSHLDCLMGLDDITSLVKSHQIRLQLLKMFSDPRMFNNPDVRESLHRDDMEVANLLQTILHSKTEKEKVLRLRDENAQSFVDVVQDTLDKGSLRENGLVVSARRLLVKLSESCNKLPTSLCIRGIRNAEREPRFGGGFADIYFALYGSTPVALKRLRMFQNDREQDRLRMRRTFCREALVWQQLRHPFILPFLGVDIESFPDFLCMVSPWMHSGTLLNYIKKGASSRLQHIFEVAQGLEYLHSQQVVHGDVRCANILVNEHGHACLADFGLAVFAEATLAPQTSHRYGSIRWMAPELHDPQAFGLPKYQQTFASDIYAFACVCLEVYTGHHPFVDLPNDATVVIRVGRGVRPGRPVDSQARSMPDALWKIVEACWTQQRFQRPSIERVVASMKKMKLKMV